MGLKRKDKKSKNIQEERTAVDEVFERRKRIKAEFNFKKSKPLLFIVAIGVGIGIIGSLYYFSPNSKIKSISVNGSYYLDEDYIKELSGLTLDDRFYFIFSPSIEKKVMKSEMVKSVKVSRKSQGIIEIAIVEEQPIGYRFLETPEILLNDGKVIEMKSEYLSIIARIPYIEGFETEELVRHLGKSFEDVDRNILETISEISQYPLSYDENTLRIYMRDGNYFFASFYSLSTINSYNEIVSNLGETGVCIYADEGLKVAYTSLCPWDAVTEEKEYWIDELGNVVVNQYGDPVEKKYYTDAQGNFILDNKGNKILIPMGGENNYDATQTTN